jgi:hypothetical protein
LKTVGIIRTIRSKPFIWQIDAGIKNTARHLRV